MGKLSAAQSHVYTLLDKLGPVPEIITQKDDEWEQWRLEDLVDNLKRFVGRNTLTTNDRFKETIVFGKHQETDPFAEFTKLG